jgi:serine/threonine protein kinase
MLSCSSPCSRQLETPTCATTCAFSVIADTPTHGGALRDLTASLENSPSAPIVSNRTNAEMTGLEVIASGSFGVVLRGVHDLDGQTYVVKQCKRRVLSESDLQNRLQEIFALAASRCAGVVQIYDAWVADSNVFIRTEYLSEGSIDSLPRPWPEELLWHLIESVGGALHWLHSNLIIHLDVKPENILFRRNPNPTGSPHDDVVFKLGDFGLARPLSDAATFTGENFSGKNDDDGDRRYLSPELMASLEGASTGFGKAADVYALGATLVDLIGGDPQAVRSGTLPHALSKYSLGFQSVVEGMTARTPSDRLDIFAVMLRARNRAIAVEGTTEMRLHTDDRLATIERLTAELEELERAVDED